MCLGCLVAGLGLAYDSEEAQEWIQKAIGNVSDYIQKVYGTVTSSYSEKDDEHTYNTDCGDCETSESSEVEAEATESQIQFWSYAQPTADY